MHGWNVRIIGSPTICCVKEVLVPVAVSTTSAQWSTQKDASAREGVSIPLEPLRRQSIAILGPSRKAMVSRSSDTAAHS